MAVQCIPVISIGSFVTSGKEEEQKVCVKQFDEACKKYGFLIIKDHGVDKETISNMEKMALKFFHQPTETKMECNVSKTYGVGGYLPQGFEKVSQSLTKNKESKPDAVESFVFNPNVHKYPSAIPEFQSVVDEYEDAMHLLLTRLHRICAKALKLKDDFFTYPYSPGWNVLRLAYYPAQEKPKMRYGAHTDYTGFTILKTDGNKGLQVLIGEKFEDVVSPPDCFIINLGDFLERWTNDLWKSNVHRVVPQAANTERLSLVYFTGPNNDILTQVIPSCITKENPCKYEPITAGEYLKMKLERTTEGKIALSKSKAPEQ